LKIKQQTAIKTRKDPEKQNYFNKLLLACRKEVFGWRRCMRVSTSVVLKIKLQGNTFKTQEKSKFSQVDSNF